MALKKWHNDFQSQANNKVTPDEIGFDHQYIVINPSVSKVWVGTTTIGGTAASKALVITNAVLDYPRNLSMAVRGTNAMSGTWVVNGKDQFGNVIQESGTVASSTAGGTTVGTKVFDVVTSGTFNFSAGSVGNGTPELGVGTGGTTALFGLPGKLGGTKDIKQVSGSFAGQGTQTLGTVATEYLAGALAETTHHAFKAPLDIPVGTAIYVCRYRPTKAMFDETVKDND